MLLATLGVLTWQQASVYQTAETLWQTTVNQNSACWLAHNNLGIALLNQGRIADAISQFQATIRSQPDYAEAHNNLGVGLAQQNQIDAAITQFQEAIRLKQDYADARDNLTRALQQKGGSNVNQPAP
jgi:tetratricopeptide (TPR) repeat protein